MDLNKFTERAKGFVQNAQSVAIRENHQRLLPEHLLKALIDDEQGLAANLISNSDGSVEEIASFLHRPLKNKLRLRKHTAFC